MNITCRDFQSAPSECELAGPVHQFQEFLSQELQRRSAEAGVYVSVDDIHHSTDKLGRIQSLQPLVRSGTLRLSRRHVTLLDQLRQFPLAAHDDGPDALEMAVSVSRVIPVTLTGVGLDDDDDEPYDPIDDDRLWVRCW